MNLHGWQTASNNVVYTNFGNMDADTDIGTFQINMLSNTLKLRHTSPVGMAVTVSALSRSVGVAQTHANTGITGSYKVGDSRLDGTFYQITANGFTIMSVSCGKFIIQQLYIS